MSVPWPTKWHTFSLTEETGIILLWLLKKEGVPQTEDLFSDKQRSYHWKVLHTCMLPRWLRGRVRLQCSSLRRHRFDPWVRISPGGGNGNPVQYFCLDSPMDRRWTEEPSELQSMGWQRDGQDWSDLAHMPPTLHQKISSDEKAKIPIVKVS